MQQSWVRFVHQGDLGFGTLTGTQVGVWQGDMFGHKQPTGVSLPLAAVELLTPSQPSKVIALWNNFKALGDKLGLAAPLEPLYFLKSANSYLATGKTIQKPSQEGKIVFEGEMGIVIGKTCAGVSEHNALENVFGYTCANDVTHADILQRDSTFAQWVRAKGFDTFCPMGPVVTSGLDPASLIVTTRLDGQVRQHFPISDMRFTVPQLVSRISHDMTLHPGDVILCGTSIGVGSMKPGSLVEVEINGIGTLTNRFGDSPITL